MKRTIIPVTLLLIAALALTGCFGAAAPAASTSTPAATSTTAAESSATPAVSQTAAAGTTTPAATGAATSAATAAGTASATTAATTAATAGATSIPNTGATAAPTSAATTAATSAATTAPTSTTAAITVPAPTIAATTAATAAATAAATVAPTTSASTSTPAASTGQTSTPVVVLPGQPGQYVRLSILLQSTLSTTQQSGKVTGVVIAQPSVSVSAGTPTPTPAQLVPYVRYAVVNMTGTNSGASRETIIPWELFTFTSSGNNLTFTLKNSANGLANAPVVSLPSQSGVLASGWDNAQTQYWASQGIAVPVTGAATQPETDILVRNTLNGTNVVDTKNQVLGHMTDILVDSTTGQFAYAVFSGGQLFGNRVFVVPVKNLIFQLQNLGAGVSGLGNIQLTFSPDMFNNAPSFNGLNLVPLDPATLNNLLNQFWQNVPSNR